MRRYIRISAIFLLTAGICLSCSDSSEQVPSLSLKKILFESNIGGNVEVFVINSDGDT